METVDIMGKRNIMGSSTRKVIRKVKTKKTVKTKVRVKNLHGRIKKWLWILNEFLKVISGSNPSSFINLI
jgi:hypothetical protein